MTALSQITSLPRSDRPRTVLLTLEEHDKMEEQLERLVAGQARIETRQEAFGEALEGIQTIQAKQAQQLASLLFWQRVVKSLAAVAWTLATLVGAAAATEWFKRHSSW